MSDPADIMLHGVPRHARGDTAPDSAADGTDDMAPGGADTGAEQLRREVASLIVTALHLELDAADIVPDEALFGEGLGLDSIDALELSLAISQRYGFELKSDDERNQRIFASLRALAAHVAQHRQR